MIHLNNLDLIYGERYVLNNLNLTIKDKDKIALIGRNGAGKSSLFKIVAGLQSPTNGECIIESNASIGILQQDIESPTDISAKEACMSIMDSLTEMNNRYAELENEMHTRTDYESEAYSDIIDEFSHLAEKIALINPDKIEGEIERILKGLGFTAESMTQLLSTLSGGWRMRVELAKILVSKPDFILLDEPNNHLDIYSIIWLEDFIRSYPGCVILISHDKTFLSNTANRILEIENGEIEKYNTNYETYLVEKEDRIVKKRSAYINQQKVIAEKERTITRFMAKATKTKMAQSMKKQLDKMDKIEFEEVNQGSFRLNLNFSRRSALEVYKISGLSKAYDDNQVLDDVNQVILRGDKIAFIGQNGQGKSTLVKIMVDEIKASSGKVEQGVNTDIGYYAQNQEDTLNPKVTVLETLEAVIPEEIRTRTRSILGSFLFSGEDVEKKVSVLSGGERARLAMACIFCRPLNVLILDEPTNHLDILSKEVLREAVNKFEGTVILVSHDRDFMGTWIQKIFSFRNREVKEFLGSISEYLDKEGLMNMREVEKETEHRKEETVIVETPTRSREEEKVLKNKIRKLEREIENLDKKKTKLEAQLLDPEVFKSDKGNELSTEHADVLERISELESSWEKLCEAL